MVSCKTWKVAKVGTVPAVNDVSNTMYTPKVKTKTKVGEAQKRKTIAKLAKGYHFSQFVLVSLR